jgi:hypothetical protein
MATRNGSLRMQQSLVERCPESRAEAASIPFSAGGLLFGSLVGLHALGLRGRPMERSTAK